MELELDIIAERLELPISTLHRWIRQGYIPVKRRGGLGVFEERTLQQWALRHQLSFSPQEPAAGGPPQRRKRKTLYRAMLRGGVFHAVPGNDVSSALLQAVDRIPDLDGSEKETLFQRLMEREELTSTGIGKGVAIPHPRTPLSTMSPHPRITTCFLADEAAYGSIDDKPVFVLFILLCPTTSIHLQLLSRLAYCVRDEAFVRFLKSAPETDSLLEKIAEFETQLDGDSD